MPLAPFVHRWRILAAAVLLAAAVASPALAQGPRNSVMYVLIGDHYFLPASITVRPRTTVVWMNQSQSVHTVVSALWNSGPLVPGQAFWRTFDVPGEYWYGDPQYNDMGMNGYVTVQEDPPVVTRTPLPAARPAAAAAPAPPAPPPPPPASPTAARTATPATAPAVGTTPAPAVSPQLASTPAALSSPVPAGSPAPGGAGSPVPAGSPMPANTPSTTSGPPSGPTSDGPSGDLPLPDSIPETPESGASLPLPLLGGGLFALGLIGTARLRRPTE